MEREEQAGEFSFEFGGPGVSVGHKIKGFKNVVEGSGEKSGCTDVEGITFRYGVSRKSIEIGLGEDERVKNGALGGIPIDKGRPRKS